MQQQIAELKGIIEEQNYQLKSLKEKQKLLYIDIDSRLVELESQNTGAQANNSPSQTTNQIKQTVVVDEDYAQSSV